ncbi:ninein isoform X1 [Willisornis vidua]|uniref:Ninein isoform X1 n=1 Tax=Willisornis vidua TaxID=1566151 RepID=A0ABQ9DNZ6_9PASS|nr:ninein isoform X1 [Willisornis vidua]
MASDYNRRASHAQTQFSVDTQTLVNKYEETLQSLQGRYQRELQELAEQQREEKSQWEFERDEIAQEVAEAHEQLRESLASEKAVSSALSQERDLLEKNFKEEVNKLVCEREQLEKELQDLRSSAEEQEKELREKIAQLQNDHEKELKDKDKQISDVQENGKLVRQKLERLESEYKQEKEQLNSKLLALASLNKDICVQTETEKAEMSLEIAALRGEIQKLQWEMRSFSALQSHYRALESEYAKAKSQIASYPGPAPLGDDAEVLQNLQKVHEQAVKENVRMAAQILRLRHRLRAAQREPHPSPGSEPEEADPSFEGLPRDCQDAEKGMDSSVLPALEADSTDLEDTMEMDSDLEEGWEKGRAGSHVLKAQECWIEGSQAALGVDGTQDCDRSQELLSWVPQLPKKRDLKKIPRPEMPHNDIKQRNAHLLNDKVAPKNKGFVPDALKLQVELEEAEELSEASSLLDPVPGSTTGDLRGVLAQLWKRVEELEDRSMAQAELLSLQEEIQVENEDLKAEMIQLIERNKVLEDNLHRLRSLHGKREDSELGSLEFKEENTQLLQKVKELGDAQEQDTQGKVSVQSHTRGGELEEHPRAFPAQQDNSRRDGAARGAPVEKREPQEPNPKEKVPALPAPNSTSCHGEERSVVPQGLQGTCSELQQKVESLRQKIEAVRKEKVAVQKMVENLKKQVAELKTRNQQLDSENTELSQKNSKNQADVQDLNQQLARVLKEKEREEGKCTLEEWEKERLVLKEELESSKIKSSNLVSSLEMEVSKMKVQAHLLEQDNHILKQELEKTKQVQSLDETLQSTTLQMSRLKSDLQATQQEKETLKQEVVSLHKQLQSTSEKTRVLEGAVPSPGLQDQHWDELEQLKEQEQKLLRQDNERLQREVQSTKADLAHSREKIRQLESTILSLKHQKHQSQSGIVKAMEQEKLSLKRECEQLQKELSSANRKINQMNSLERELETSSENEGLRKKQVKLDDQLMELSKNTKADAMVKDLYVENAQLLKALEATEQRQRSAERKNYLLEEKISNLTRIVRTLAAPSLGQAPEVRS